MAYAPSHAVSSQGSLKRVNRRISSSKNSWRRQVSPSVLVSSLALISYGALVIWTASLSIPEASFPRQLLGIGIGLIAMVGVWRFDFRNLANLSTVLIVIDIILIFSPYVPGLSYSAKGMTGWIKIPLIGLTFQPVELVKIVTIMFISALGAQYNGKIDTVRDYLKLCGMLAVPVLAIIALRDLGSAIIVLFAGAIVIMMSGAKKEWVLSTIALLAGLISLVLATNSIMHSMFGDHFALIKDYQMNRLLVFMDPSKDTSGAGYNLQQALIAVGSGGFFGKGIGGASQAVSGFLPEAQTDFVFALLSEEFGFIGAFLLLVLFAWLILSAIRVAVKTDNLFMKLVCVGIVGMWTFQVFENVGMCIGLMPITGIPLPFISFGSSSMIIQCMAVGLVQSIWRHHVSR
ncbi:cell elongation-specific peptidoglycan biosynthesis regulator RodA [Coriobacterium glomerans PW2]|uniref:Cell elongation-specific peptidoglycan biosynthesis regulator RodA n=1 Tax=Coriobacterium glomerans (strain ATCC 49209 / DSM 20642 / JCM 10262 / PW2) TaxID=700015 RepID=F2N7S8_CORGP|nr:FtsW/RodA/SpoVE family cell cycle protein [Coriobacterium glomerans]AEB06970.1 cell elongation-specific peptidoglycan biosynthesis regulator RodA [Coriobacterium glomerans PW2]